MQLDMQARLFVHKRVFKAALVKDGVGGGERWMVGYGPGAFTSILTQPADIRTTRSDPGCWSSWWEVWL